MITILAYECVKIKEKDNGNKAANTLKDQDRPTKKPDLHDYKSEDKDEIVEKMLRMKIYCLSCSMQVTYTTKNYNYFFNFILQM